MIILPTLTDLMARLKSRFANEFNQSSPFTPNSFLGSILNSISGEFYQFYLKMDYMLRQTFIVTADKEYLKLHGQHIISDLSATKASGDICFGGIVGTNIPLGAIFTLNKSNIEYETTENVTIAISTYNPSWISSCNTLVTVTIKNHGLSDGLYTISGALNSVFNGTFNMNVVNQHTLTYSIDDNRTYSENPNNMVAILTADIAISKIESVDVGKDKNLDSYSMMQSQTTIAGLDTAIIIPNGLNGGTDDETVEEYRERLLMAIRNPRIPFTRDHIIGVIKDKYREITRVTIREQYPSFNSIMIYAVNDDANPITLTPTQLTNIRDTIRDIRPINLPENGIETENPTLKNINVIVSGIIPNSTGLREVVKYNIESYFLTLDIGEDIIKDNLGSIIAQSVDYRTGLRVESYNLDLANVIISPNELAIANSVIT